MYSSFLFASGSTLFLKSCRQQLFLRIIKLQASSSPHALPLSIFKGATPLSAHASLVTTASAVTQDEEAQLQNHPFYHVPWVNPNYVTREISPEIPTFRGHEPLNAIYGIFKKKVLEESDVIVLTFETSRLLSFAVHQMDKVLTGKPSEAVETAATMLLVLDTLFAVGTVLGPKCGAPRWWPALINTIPKNDHFCRKRFNSNLQSIEYLYLIQGILDTIDVYRAGQRPPAAALVPLKQRFICANPPKKFRTIAWRAWRNDDELWRKQNKVFP